MGEDRQETLLLHSLKVDLKRPLTDDDGARSEDVLYCVCLEGSLLQDTRNDRCAFLGCLCLVRSGRYIPSTARTRASLEKKPNLHQPQTHTSKNSPGYFEWLKVYPAPPKIQGSESACVPFFSAFQAFAQAGVLPRVRFLFARVNLRFVMALFSSAPIIIGSLPSGMGFWRRWEGNSAGCWIGWSWGIELGTGLGVRASEGVWTTVCD